ncbi:MAG: flagellin, partial [Actinomycetia bacterium]|nr:flagellin [Actinomycetes bacterium]
RNANDAISLSQAAESALQQSTSILQRMRELSIQAANDINSEQDREALQNEVDQLIDELTRIGTSTTFNGQKLLDGSFVDAFFHVGAFARETVRVRIRDARAETIGRAATFTGNVVDGNAMAAGDVVLNGVEVRASRAVDDQLSTAGQAASAIAKAAAINASTDFHGVTAKPLPTEAVGADRIGAVVLDTDNNIIVNGEIISGITVEADDASEALISAINEAYPDTGVVASLDAQGRLRLEADDGRNIDVQVNGAAAQAALNIAAGTYTAALHLHSDEQYVVGGNAEDRIGFGDNALVGVTNADSINTVDITTRYEANESILKIDRALEQINSDRAELGAVTNRMQSTLSNLTTVIEASSASRSRIQDADFATETSSLTKHQILQQAGISILSQANSNPQAVLSLLQQ